MCDTRDKFKLGSLEKFFNYRHQFNCDTNHLHPVLIKLLTISDFFALMNRIKYVIIIGYRFN